MSEVILKEIPGHISGSYWGYNIVDMSSSIVNFYIVRRNGELFFKMKAEVRWNAEPYHATTISAYTLRGENASGNSYTVGYLGRNDFDEHISIYRTGSGVRYAIDMYIPIDREAKKITRLSTSHSQTGVPSNDHFIFRIKSVDTGSSDYYYFTPVNRVTTNNPIIIEDSWYNTEPTVTLNRTDNQTLYEKPEPFTYTVNDEDGDTMTITEKIDGRIIRTFTGDSGTYTFTVSHDEWIKTRLDTSVQLTVIADDGNGGVTEESVNVIRKETAIDFQLKTPFLTDVRARRILLSLDGQLPAAANITIEACNNAFDDNPTWENITHLALQGFPYPFNNENKTAANWGVSFRVRIERGNETGPIYLDGIGGAFD